VILRASRARYFGGVLYCPSMPPPMPVVLVPHDPRWIERARLEGERFAQSVAIEVVHHIGSTSIAGIHAKPILDLLPVVASLGPIDAARDALASAGYAWWGEYGLTGRRYFTRDEAGVRIANVHVYERGSPAIARHLAFRDYLRTHGDVARAYDEEKARARALHPEDSYAYTDEKAAFIRRVEADALRWASS
jgi:GrpB-like predicted nucleotidyltransferase (UPF0157 family)